MERKQTFDNEKLINKYFFRDGGRNEQLPPIPVARYLSEFQFFPSSIVKINLIIFLWILKGRERENELEAFFHHIPSSHSIARFFHQQPLRGEA